MKYFYIRKILDIEQLKIVKNLLDQANKNNLWIDGLFSAGEYKEIKNNVELNDISLCQGISNLIMNSLDNDKKFINFTSAKSTYLNIISKTIAGGYYNPHIDDWSNGDYSTTVFLNDPEEYSGGELCLYFGGEDDTKIKLPAGWGVTYSTGIVHRVNRVVNGTRYVSVFWTESSIKDQFIRFLYSEICNIEEYIADFKKPVHLLNCYSAYEDPQFCISNLKTQILRRYASK